MPVPLSFFVPICYKVTCDDVMLIFAVFSRNPIDTSSSGPASMTL